MGSLGADDPAEVGAYRLLGVLGHGGMGRVYLGRSQGGRLVAVKVVHRHLAADERFRARFASEVAAARLVSGEQNHNRTAPVLTADPEAEVPWVATGYVAGSDLAHMVEEHGPLPERTVRALGIGLAEALGAVHAQGLVHRDVKPSNVLLALDGPHLIDFGIARAAEAATRLTSTGVAVGSPGFMAPEQVTGEAAVGPATDVFSLGTVLAYAASGQQPFPGESAAQLLYRVAHAEPRLDGVAPDAVKELVSACLAKDPAARPTLPEVVRALAGEQDAGASLDSSRWLPTAVADDIGRRAVELLQLESGPADPGLPARPHSPTLVDSAPASGPNAATVTVTAQPKPETTAKPELANKPEPPDAQAKKQGPWLAVGASALLAVLIFGVWNAFQDDDKTAALPNSFVGHWSDSANGYGNQLELNAGRVGEEVGRLTADVDACRRSSRRVWALLPAARMRRPARWSRRRSPFWMPHR
ncbi:putative serine/threonine protein kinase [Streptomyces bingchenggensis BCW-1]|uniref:Putative serine/threonine protein kinase n=1 Tax=Streptomyces bingchenggensis (strain BCW-1) TaxID=749414 RepID=D7BUH9_STRBB|nr:MULTISPECIES: serine/threonine-protein kinase [Streptomyces]ADI03170.1 putative serine/threonine protein kinase [Streptomyces bingchenggensis BCW-1]